MEQNNVIKLSFDAARNNKFGRRLIPARLKDARKSLRLTQDALGLAVGVTRQAISSYESGEKSPDPEIFSKLMEALGQPPSFFTTPERSVIGDYSPRFFRKSGPETARRNEACAVLGNWFAQAVSYLDEFVNFPTPEVPQAERPTDPAGRYTDEEIENAAEACRRAWGLGWGPISNVMALLESKGIASCRYELEGERIDAFSFWCGVRPLVFLAVERESGARVRFDLAHELGHLVLHRWIEDDELKDPKTLKCIEAEADRFAGAFLLPRRSFPNEVYTPRLDYFVDLKRRWGVSVQGMVYRCKNLEVIDDSQFTNLYKQISFRKWRKKEPLDDPNVMRIESPKLLAKAISLLIESGRKDASDICNELALRPSLIEAFYNLPKGQLSATSPSGFSPTLK